MSVVKNPVAWVVAALTVISVVGLTPVLGAAVSASPVGAVVGAILWALYAALLWWLVRRISRARPRPRGTTLLAFLWGGVVVAGLGTYATRSTNELFSSLISDQAWAGAVSAGVSEEALKLLGVFALAMLLPHRMRTTLDYIYYGIFVGLGFEVVESFLYSAQAASTSDTPVIMVVGTLLLRGVVNGLWSHPTYTAVAAAGLGYFMTSGAGRVRRAMALVGALVIAMAAHAFYDSPVLEGNVLIASVAKGLPILILFLLLWRAFRREAARAETAGAVVPDGGVPGSGVVETAASTEPGAGDAGASQRGGGPVG